AVGRFSTNAQVGITGATGPAALAGRVYLGLVWWRTSLVVCPHPNPLPGGEGISVRPRSSIRGERWVCVVVLCLAMLLGVGEVRGDDRAAPVGARVAPCLPVAGEAGLLAAGLLAGH